MSTIALTVNERPIEALAEPRTSLADFVRETLDLTGTHLGCEHGVCGACTVLLDGVPARSCITYAVACEGADVTTIEGLDDDDITAELRAAFTREHALQCGYCTPGMLVSARDLVLRLPEADEKLIRIGLSGNLCRCTGYVGIVRAVSSVIEQRRQRGVAPDRDSGRKSLGPVGSGRGKQAGTGQGNRALPQIAQLSHEAASVGSIPDFTPAHVLEQHFDVAHPADQVFAMLEDIASVAACLPGASLIGQPDPERVEGAIRVKIGPISATFQGAARVERNPADMSGRIVGIGTDQRSRSSTQGEVRYYLKPIGEGTATRIDLSIGYALKGMLAQVGRPGLVRDLASRLIAEFAANLDRRLSGAPQAATGTKSADLNGLSLLFGVLRARFARWLAPSTSNDGGA
jgi:aerobic carbon-monoxide dehydrogenase small subunit